MHFSLATVAQPVEHRAQKLEVANPTCSNVFHMFVPVPAHAAGTKLSSIGSSERVTPMSTSVTFVHMLMTVFVRFLQTPCYFWETRECDFPFITVAYYCQEVM